MRKTRSKSRRVRRVMRKRGGDGLWNTLKGCVGNTCSRKKMEAPINKSRELERCHEELEDMRIRLSMAHEELQKYRPAPSRSGIIKKPLHSWDEEVGKRAMLNAQAVFMGLPRHVRQSMQNNARKAYFKATIKEAYPHFPNSYVNEIVEHTIRTRGSTPY